MTQWTPVLMMTAINYLKTPSVSTFYTHINLSVVILIAMDRHTWCWNM